MTEHAVVIVGNELADTRYLAYLLSIMQLGHLSAQSAQPGLSVQTLSKLSINIPDISTQRRIVGILGSLDDLSSTYKCNFLGADVLLEFNL